MKTEDFRIAEIRIVARRRPVAAGKLADLEKSISEIGLCTPLTVRVVDEVVDPEDGTVTDGVVYLVAGAHRLAAVKALGWETVPCFVLPGDERDAQLWEIAENLHRADLTVAERAEHIAEWVRLVSDAKPGQVAQVSGGRGKEGGVSAATRELGIERTEVRRALRIAGLSDEAKEAARQAGLDDNQSAMLRAAAKPAEEQADAIREIAERPRPVKPAPAPLNDFETEEVWRGAILRVWNRGAADWRERFLATVDEPVFSSTKAGVR